MQFSANGDWIVTTHSDALALAVVLSSEDEVLLGPTDSALCAEALRYYARSERHAALIRELRVPALALAIMICAIAFVHGVPVVTAALG